MRYMITGGAGFIGSNFIYYMFEKYGTSIEIVNIDCLSYAGNLGNLNKLDNELLSNNNYTFEKTNICDHESISGIFRNYEPDYVINFAAESHVDRSIEDPQIFLKTNVLGTQVLLENSLKYGVKRFHQVSTDEVYGSLGQSGFFSESSPIDPHSPYSASKASADLICKAYFDTFRLPITISRCSNNYGPYQHPEKLIPMVITNALVGKNIPVFGDGLNIRDWLHVDDHCRAIDLIVHKAEDSEVFNIGGHNEFANINIVKLILRELLNLLPKDHLSRNVISEKLITFVDDRLGHDRRYAINPEKMKKTFDWEPDISFKKGIKSTIKWYLDNQKWLNNLFQEKV
ncbi:dTDP-glucose 4,6-dehydratase [Alkalihalobacillus sp. AL-G]|uniref:dTDP-glucose 4,6-dehydratase n=1 Tax=Alkalihalobacillus sp. AL-G TaxID=2926399 RepID=UPI00272D7EE6|nr:dTDP-glucose 4,6-dehydratase [Alkalihalobacillus sp. AL-G]WLD93017.1 dTDP-glucose 4,6-dehydratase [Alkalihalobacillus sp. AL-G]